LSGAKVRSVALQAGDRYVEAANGPIAAAANLF
jgi:hypothetical protein